MSSRYRFRRPVCEDAPGRRASPRRRARLFSALASSFTLLLPLAACDESPTDPGIDAQLATVEAGPGQVTDLRVSAVTDSSVTLTFTEVDDGAGGPADYAIRHDASSITWRDGTLVMNGSCARPVEGRTVGATRSCTVQGLEAGTTYALQMVAYRGTPGVDAVFGDLSNITTKTTLFSDGSTAPDPGRVTDLAASAVTDSSVTLTFREVDDGTGAAAHYAIRHDVSSITWRDGTLVMNGSCARPVEGRTVGTTRSCTVQGVEAGTTYAFQMVAYRGTPGVDAVFGDLSNVTTRATSGSTSSTASGDAGIWISAAELSALPTSGSAWNELLSDANQSCGTVDLANQDQSNNVCIMAKALVFARTGQARYRTDVVAALTQIVGAATYNGRALALGRELGAYVIAADLIDLKSFDRTLNGAFRSTIRGLLTTYTHSGPDNIVECHEVRPNNWGTHCGGARAAVAAYLGDTAELDRVARVFKGWLGDRSSYAGFNYGDLSWQCDSNRPVGINPVGCTRDGHSIDGVLADDQRRGGTYTWPAPKENYVWEGLQGAMLQAVILERAGYPAFEWGNRALLRAVRWLYSENGYPAEGDDSWQPHIINHHYGTSFAAPTPSRPGKNVGYTDWTHR